MRHSTSVPDCGRDCFHCPYPDCVVDDMDLAELQQSKEIDAIINPKTRAEAVAAAKQKAYREAHREEIAAQQKAYYEAHREEIAARRKARREARRKAANG